MIHVLFMRAERGIYRAATKITRDSTEVFTQKSYINHRIHNASRAVLRVPIHITYAHVFLGTRLKF